ncbi:hypothetical protein [Streptomyces kanasensis]|uniref:hypothetical protein n=1 Tax=Streptomyces kanasensis TaxID=936756 RepID=UPI0037FC4DDC
MPSHRSRPTTTSPAPCDGASGHCPCSAVAVAVAVLVIVVAAVLVVAAGPGTWPVPRLPWWCGTCLSAVTVARLVAAPPVRRTTIRLRLRLAYVAEPFPVA